MFEVLFELSDEINRLTRLVETGRHFAKPSVHDGQNLT